MKLNIDEFLASVMQRMIYNEIKNQNGWKKQDIENGYTEHTEIRDQIIKGLNELADQLEKNGIEKYKEY